MKTFLIVLLVLVMIVSFNTVVLASGHGGGHGGGHGYGGGGRGYGYGAYGHGYGLWPWLLGRSWMVWSWLGLLGTILLWIWMVSIPRILGTNSKWISNLGTWTVGDLLLETFLETTVTLVGRELPPLKHPFGL